MGERVLIEPTAIVTATHYPLVTHHDGTNRYLTKMHRDTSLRQRFAHP